MANQLNIGDHAPNGLVRDVQGNEVQIASLWGKGTTLLTFLRHFG